MLLLFGGHTQYSNSSLSVGSSPSRTLSTCPSACCFALRAATAQMRFSARRVLQQGISEEERKGLFELPPLLLLWQEMPILKFYWNLLKMGFSVHDCEFRILPKTESSLNY